MRMPLALGGMSARQRPCTLSNCSRCAVVAAAPALEFVEVHHLQPVAGARVVRLPLGRAHRGAQRQAADAAHAVDADGGQSAQRHRGGAGWHRLRRMAAHRRATGDAAAAADGWCALPRAAPPLRCRNATVARALHAAGLHTPPAHHPARVRRTAAGWIGAAPLGRLLGIAADVDSVIAVAAIVALVASGAIGWPDIEQHTQWGVLLLFGGGLALSEVMAISGASRFMADALTAPCKRGTPDWLVLLGIIAFVVMLTELVSNTAARRCWCRSSPCWPPTSASIRALCPQPLRFRPRARSCCPVATPPNALVFGTGRCPQASMMRCGLVLNLVCIAVITAVATWAFA
jgi:hypothetical protein